MTIRWLSLLCAAGWLAAAPVQAQVANTYKCQDAKGKVIYTEKPCVGAKDLDEKKVKADARKEKPPQDRARAANRAKLSPETLQKCDALAVTIKDQEAELKAKAQPVNPEDERPLTQSRKQYREMKCA